MSKWFRVDSDIDDSIETLYVCGYNTDKFIVCNGPIANRHVTYVMNSQRDDLDKFYHVLSESRIPNLSARRIIFTPVESKLWYRYIDPFYYTEDLTYAVQILKPYRTDCFNRLMDLLLTNMFSDIEICWMLLDRTILSKHVYEVRDIKSETASLFVDDDYKCMIPNYFSSSSAELFMSLMVNVFYSDGIPYVTNPQQYSNSSMFDTKISSVISKPNTIVIDVDIEFLPSNNYILTYMSSYRYIVPRSIKLNKPNINVTQCKPQPLKIQRHTPDEIVFISNLMSKTKLFNHKFMNFLNFMDIDYERLLWNHKTSSNLLGPNVNSNSNNQMNAIFAAKGQNWGMTKTLYEMIASHYTKTYEAFGTQWNYFLPHHGDIMNGSFFDSNHRDYDCIIANPPFTENIIKSTLVHSLKIIRRSSPVTIWMFFPLWLDCIKWIKTVNCHVFALRNNLVFDFENNKHYSVNTMVIVITNNYSLKERDIIRSLKT